MNFDFSGKVAVVTGAASGIGLAIATDLLQAGAALALIDIQQKPEHFDHPKIIYYQGDLTDAGFVRQAISDTYAKHGQLHYLANVAGALWFDRDRSFAEIDLDIWDQVMAINLKSALHAARAAVPCMLKSGGGAMVHFSSIQCLRGDEQPQDAYQAAKAGIVALSKSIAMQYAKHNIRSNTILPGPTHTPLQSRWDNDPEAKHAVARHIPLGRVGTAKDMAGACLFLLSDAASFITGTELIVDGGLTALP